MATSASAAMIGSTTSPVSAVGSDGAAVGLGDGSLGDGITSGEGGLDTAGEGLAPDGDAPGGAEAGVEIVKVQVARCGPCPSSVIVVDRTV